MNTMNTTISELTRRLTTTGLAATIAAAAGLAAAGPASAQQQYETHYEWEPDEGLHEEEWYDPSDWFDDWFDEQLIDYESDWYEGDWYQDNQTLNRDSRDSQYSAYDIYHVYYTDLYDTRQRDQTQGQQHAQRQQSQQGQQQTQGQRSAELRGQLEDWRRVNLQGQRDAHTLVRLRLEDGTRKIVNLGPNIELSRLDLSQGDRIIVHGDQGTIDGRSVIMAQRIRVGDSTITMDNWDPQSQRSQRQAQQRTAWGEQEQRSTGQDQQDQRRQKAQRQRDSAMNAGQSSDRGMHPGARMVQQIIADWAAPSRKAAESMLSKYGKPDGVTPKMLVWRNTGPFVKTVVHADPVQHNFPRSHEDVLEQFVNFKVPADKMDELARFDGSIIVFRTDGLMSARCHKESMNILALNLAAHIAEDKKSVDEARQKFAETATAYMEGDKPELTQRLTFQTSSRNSDRPNASDASYGSRQASNGGSR